MTDLSAPQRRERQILEILYAHTARRSAEIQTVTCPPIRHGRRRLLSILEEKGHVRRATGTRERLFPAVSRSSVRPSGAPQCPQHLLFGGYLEQALAMHLTDKQSGDQRGKVQRMLRLIEQARQEAET